MLKKLLKKVTRTVSDSKHGYRRYSDSDHKRHHKHHSHHGSHYYKRKKYSRSSS